MQPARASQDGVLPLGAILNDNFVFAYCGVVRADSRDNALCLIGTAGEKSWPKQTARQRKKADREGFVLHIVLGLGDSGVA